jgi:hypothetical protein
LKPSPKLWPSKDNPPVASFLFTPGFSSLIKDDSQFLPNALQKIFVEFGTPSESMPEEAHTLVAVVDRLPVPNDISNRTDPRDYSAEGVAIAVGTLNDMAPDLWIHQCQDAFNKAALKFNIEMNRTESSSIASVTLPLANTIFQTGSPSTMMASTWTFDSNAFARCKTISKTIQTLRLKATDTPYLESATSVPLLPLTVPRAIMGVFGNIIRRTNAKQGPNPASHELEAALDTYFKSRSLSSRYVDVWALILPQNVTNGTGVGGIGRFNEIMASKKMQTIWKDTSEFKNAFQYVGDCIERGARLHRVLSGGGGWGSKQGLLSLDPWEDSYWIGAARQTAVVENEHHLTEEFRDVANSGDFIQFFFVPPNAPFYSESDQTAGRTKFEFGTTVSTMDEMSTPCSPDGISNQVKVLPNYFGAVSGEGIGVIVPKSRSSNKDGETMLHQTETKIDVPASRIRWFEGST